MKILRAFPRRTNLSPDDEDVRFDPPGFFDEADRIDISVLFSWDRDYAEWLAEQWKPIAPVEIGGPAYNKPSGEFIPGKYVKRGAVITSRGCPNKCWFCSVWKREPELIELPVTDGFNVLDDNLLACSEGHIRKVFAMLKRQKERAQFTGGLEAAILKDWHIELLTELNPAQMFFAYDTPDDKEPLRIASIKLHEAGFNRHKLRCYCLIGYPKDTMGKAEERLQFCLECGFFPMAMLWKDLNGYADKEWMRFQKVWARPASIYSKWKLLEHKLKHT